MDVLEARSLDLSFPFNKGDEAVHAVDDVTFSLEEGEFLGLVGSSGCGKSTLARILTGLVKPDEGTLAINGEQVMYPFPRRVYRNLQMVFQLPQESFNPKRTIGSAITDLQRNFGATKQAASDHTTEILHQVGLEASYAKKYPHQMSGGECQRAAIARAFSVAPKIVICDEATSALDVSVQAQIVELLAQMNERMGVSVLFISHDIALVQGLCSRMMVMNDGAIVEEGPSAQIMRNPGSECTKRLLDAVLTV